MKQNLRVAWRVLVTIALSAGVMLGIHYAWHPAVAIIVALVSTIVMPTAAIMIMRLRKREPAARIVVASSAVNMLAALFFGSSVLLSERIVFSLADFVLVVLTFWFAFVSLYRWKQIERGAHNTAFNGRLSSPFAILKRTDRPAKA